MKKIILIITGILLLNSACNDWLEVTPRTQVRGDEMFDTYKGFRDALTGCYILMNDRTAYGEYLSISAVECLANLWDVNEGDRQEVFYPLSQFDYENDSVRTAVKKMYGALYKVIVQANAILEEMPEKGHVIANEATRAVIEGEALAIRAFCHLDILRMFGQLPQGGTRTVMLPYSEKVSKDPVPYYSFEGFSNKIRADLDKSEELLRDNDPLFKYSFDELSEDSEVNADSYLLLRQFRFNYYAVKALQARFYLYIGEKSNAYEAAKAVIDAKNPNGTPVREFTGKDDYEKGSNSAPSECLVALTNTDLKKYAGDLLGGTTDKTMGSEKLGLTPAQFRTLFSGFETSTRYVYAWNQNTLNSYGQTRVSCAKYVFTDLGKRGKYSELYQIVPLLRLSEMYLIQIETASDLNEASRLYRTYLDGRNVYSEKVFDSEEDVRATLLAEYRREFFAEGQMFYTYKRYNASEMLWCKDPVEEDNYIVPLPDSEYNANL